MDIDFQFASYDKSSGLWYDPAHDAFCSETEIRFVHTEVGVKGNAAISNSKATLYTNTYEDHLEFLARETKMTERTNRFCLLRQRLAMIKRSVPGAAWAIERNLDDAQWAIVGQVRSEYSDPAIRAHMLWSEIPVFINEKPETKDRTLEHLRSRGFTDDFLVFEANDRVELLRLAGIRLIDLEEMVAECPDELGGIEAVDLPDYASVRDSIERCQRL